MRTSEKIKQSNSHMNVVRDSLKCLVTVIKVQMKLSYIREK